MRKTRRLAAIIRTRGAQLLLVLALAVATGAVTVAQARPAAAATCSGSGCNGKDPASYCSATSTPREWFIDQDTTLQLRYSSKCHAFWGRAFQSCGKHLPPLHIRVERQIYTPYGYARERVYYDVAGVPCNGDPGWTRMVGNYDSDRQRSCVGHSWDGRPASQMPEDWWSWCTDEHGGWVY